MEKVDRLGNLFLFAGFWSLIWSLFFAMFVVTIPLSLVSAGVSMHSIRRGFQLKNGDGFDTKDTFPKASKLHFATILTMDIIGVVMAVMMSNSYDDPFLKAYLQGNATTLAGIQPSSVDATPRTTQASNADATSAQSPWGDVDRYEELLQDPNASSEGVQDASSPWGELDGKGTASAWEDLPSENSEATSQEANVHATEPAHSKRR